jgi:hypothetical protein
MKIEVMLPDNCCRESLVAATHTSLSGYHIAVDYAPRQSERNRYDSDCSINCTSYIFGYSVAMGFGEEPLLALRIYFEGE